MRRDALAPYEESLADEGDLALVSESGEVLALDVRRYLDDVDDGDESILDRCAGPTLDLGAGPGRMVRALAARGIVTLGVDLAAGAVAISNENFGIALQRDVFERLPGEGRWAEVLLVDGNVGIGGDVDRLLARVADLLDPDGRVIAETAGEGDVDVVWQARFVRGGTATGPAFPWAQIGTAALLRHAAVFGFTLRHGWTRGPRHFVELSRA